MERVRAEVEEVMGDDESKESHLSFKIPCWCEQDNMSEKEEAS